MNLLPKQLRGQKRVPVFNPEDYSLRLAALSQLDRSFTPLQSPFSESLRRMLIHLASQYIILDIPRLHPRFDIYGSNELDTTKTYAVVTRKEHAKVGMKYITRLDFYRLGWWRAGIMRMVGTKYRRLWVGPIPASARPE